jgi:ketosteroid isomerase-like protein
MRRSMILIPMLAVSFALPDFASAQQPNAADQKMRQQVESVVMQYVDAINKGNAQAYVALFAPNAIDINPYGKHTGAQLGENIERVHKMGLTLTVKVDDVEPIFGGQGAMATAPYTGNFANNPGTTQVQGNLMFVLERAGDGWKVKIQTASRLAPTAPAK